MAIIIKFSFLNILYNLLIISIVILIGESKKFHYEYVTCGSSIKLMNVQGNVRLHSHDVKYGTGSGQQSVTAVVDSDDTNSYWQIIGKNNKPCKRGEPIKCGATIRFMHLSTQRYLHSHHFASPLSNNIEVSAFGDHTKLDSDSGDEWVVVCDGKQWNRNNAVRIKHIVTNTYLHVTGDTFGRPIHGQREVCGFKHSNSMNTWKAMEGIYVTPAEDIMKSSHDEL